MRRYDSRRSEDPEIMDDLDCSGEVVYQTLREIGFINKTLGGNGVTLSGLKTLLHRKGSYSLADLGCGGGEMLPIIHRWGEAHGYHFHLTGIDANPHIVRYASEAVKKENVVFKTENVAQEPFLEGEYDIITATLFAHHFSSGELAVLLRKWMKKTRVGMVINDLHRHPLAYYSIKLLTHLFSKSAMVRYDAPLSVQRGFSRKEWRQILEQAGIKNYTLRWRWAFRWEVVLWR